MSFQISGIKDKTIQIEKQVINLCINNDEFLSQMSPKLNESLFSGFYKQTYLLVDEFYSNYKKAPKELILSLIESKKITNPEKDYALIEEICYNAIAYPLDSENTPFFIDLAMNFIRSRKISNLCNNLFSLGLDFNFDIAEQAISEFTRETADTSGFIDPFSDAGITSFFQKKDENYLFKFDDVLGDVIGEIKRGDLISFAAPEKGGKTHWLFESLFSALEKKLNCVFFSHEMSEEEVLSIIYRRLCGYPDEAYAGEIIFPVFDCESNQNGSCKSELRRNTISFIDPREKYKDKSERKPIRFYFDDGKYEKHRVCTACDKFVPSYWFSKMTKRAITEEDIQRKIKIFKMFYGLNLRIKSFPAFSANFQDIERHLEILEDSGFIPDVVVDDYLDIHSPEGKQEGIDGIDVAWKTAKRVASKKKVAYITAQQAKATARDKYYPNINDFWSDSKKKTAHLNKLISISQTLPELEDGVSRLSLLLSRGSKTSIRKQVLCLSCMELALPNTDCCLI